MLQERFWTIDIVTRLEVLAICSSISLYEPKRHRSCVEDGLVLAVVGRCALVARLGVGGRRSQTVNFTFENFEDQDEVGSEASAFQREEVELAKPFLIWHVTKTSH